LVSIRNSIQKAIQALRIPSSKFALGTLVGAGLILGVVFVPTFNWVVHETSSDEFCMQCHANDIGQEQAGRAHYDNAIGFRATCADCHIPREFIPKLVHKTKSGVNDIYHQVFLGTISTPEKFEAHRMHMATAVWDAMNENDSRNCRYCHVQDRWDPRAQSEKAQEYHSGALARGKTCIDCHKGLAHNLPAGIEEDHQVEGIDF
jgi:nitrate/TMAO reductase-like tetraheme cytochrome c subunit